MAHPFCYPRFNCWAFLRKTAKAMIGTAMPAIQPTGAPYLTAVTVLSRHSSQKHVPVMRMRVAATAKPKKGDANSESNTIIPYRIDLKQKTVMRAGSAKRKSMTSMASIVDGRDVIIISKPNV